MNKLQKNIVFFSMVLSLITTFLYVYIRIFDLFLSDITHGDEICYILGLNQLIDFGFSEANIYGNSTFYNCFTYLIYQLGFDILISLRLVSLMFAIFSVFLLNIFVKKYFRYLPSLYRKSILITSINAMVIMSFIFMGINDSLLTFFMLLFFIVYYRLKEKNNDKAIIPYVFIGAIAAFMLATREMALLLYPTFLLILSAFFIRKKYSAKLIFSKIGISLSAFFIVIFLFNYPSLKENGKLSFLIKTTGNEDVSWAQRQYLTAMWVEEGQVEYLQHCSVEDVALYLYENGEDSLPNSTLETITFDIARTIRTFLREIVFLVKPFTRYFGLMLIIGIALFIRGLFKREIGLKKIFNNEIFVFMLNYSCILALIICSYIEIRWLMPVIVLLPILLFSGFYKFVKGKKNNSVLETIVFSTHFLLLAIMNLKFIYNNYQLIF